MAKKVENFFLQSHNNSLILNIKVGRSGEKWSKIPAVPMEAK